jgi:hypothetical protein
MSSGLGKGGVLVYNMIYIVYLLFINITCRRQQHDMLSALVNTSQLKHYRKLHQLDVKENRKGERSKMDNPNTQATLGTRHRTKKNSTYNTTQTIKMMINTDPMQKPGVHPHACEG